MYTEETRTDRNLNFSERNSEKLKNSQICVNKLRKKTKFDQGNSNRSAF